MTAAAHLIHELRCLGIELMPEGERIRYRAPRGVFTADLRSRLQAQRDEVLKALRWPGGGDAAQTTDGSFVEATEEIGAVLLRSATFGDVWLARDERVAQQLIDEVAEAGRAIPVFTFDEAALFRGKSERMLRALLTAKAALPGSRLLQ